ncbi:antitoxin [Inquilinus sp. CA228]|jgi:antitoxin VapB|uniref:antitoxin n=1 Tax=Inquilinus sp. CA228 TaxID=3455609 RepID=UPI003F8D2CFE
MVTARVFRSGNGQAVQLPKQFRFEGRDVEVFRRGDEIVLREKRRGMARAFELLAELPIGIEGRNDLPPQERKS